MSVLVASKEGLHPFDDEGLAGPLQLTGRAVTTVAPGGRELWAVIEGSELWRANDGEWSHTADLDGPRATCVAVAADSVFVGSSEARVFRLDGARLEAIATFDRAEGRSDWYTP